MVCELLFRCEGSSNGNSSGEDASYGHGYGPVSGSGAGSSDGSGFGPGLADGSGFGSGDGEGFGEGPSHSYRDEGVSSLWPVVHSLALASDLEQLHHRLRLDLEHDPETQAVALDLAREQGLRTLLGVLRA